MGIPPPAGIASISSPIACKSSNLRLDYQPRAAGRLTENLTKNLQLSIGVLFQYSSGLSLSHSSTPATNRFQKTQTVTGDTVTIGSSIRYTENNSSKILPVYHNRYWDFC